MSKVALMLISDGRDEYLQQCMASAMEMLPTLDYHVHINDAGHKLGFDGAVREGWARVRETDADYLLWLEQDFTFRRYVDVAAMIRVLEAHPYLVQMALLRQPWNAAEREAGGIVEQHPESYTTVQWAGFTWREHRRFFTTNVNLTPRWVFERDWPVGAESEGRFGCELFAEDEWRRSAFWGKTVWIDHLGVERVGHGY